MKIAVFVSGRGSNMEAILSAIGRGELQSQVVLVFSDNPDSKALQTARANGITAISDKRPDAAHLLRILSDADADFIVLAGYLKLVPKEVVEAFSGRIVNIHPALLPKFGGKGFYGMNVHEAVLKEMREMKNSNDSNGSKIASPQDDGSGDTGSCNGSVHIEPGVTEPGGAETDGIARKDSGNRNHAADRSGSADSAESSYFTGATVHFIDAHYDRGRILLQAKVDVSDLDSAEKIAARVLILEHRILVAAIRIIEEGKI